MNNEQIKIEIERLSERRKLFESFLLPIFTGIVIASATENFLHNAKYISLCLIGAALIIIFIRQIIKLDKQIKSLINQIQ